MLKAVAESELPTRECTEKETFPSNHLQHMTSTEE